MSIRPATSADAPVLTELDAAAFGAQAWTAAAVEQELAAASRIVLLADGAPALGWASVSVAGDVADLTRIGVRPQARRTGVARALVEDGAARAGDGGARRMLLEVAEDNHAALSLYDTCGFRRIATRRHYYPGGIDALVLERTL